MQVISHKNDWYNLPLLHFITAVTVSAINLWRRVFTLCNHSCYNFHYTIFLMHPPFEYERNNRTNSMHSSLKVFTPKQLK